MPRTTIDIDAPILRDLKRLQKREGKSLGRLISDLLARALGDDQAGPTPTPFRWISRDMGTERVDLSDKDALWTALNDERAAPRR